jgi:hypothetical protein
VNTSTEGDLDDQPTPMSIAQLTSAVESNPFNIQLILRAQSLRDYRVACEAYEDGSTSVEISERIEGINILKHNAIT